MRINLVRLREEPFEYEVALSPELLAGDMEEDLRFETGTGTVTFRMVGAEVIATGELRTVVHSPCARCLAPVSREVTAPVHLFYWPDKRENESTIEDIDPAEPDFGYYEGDSLDPDPDLREILVVEAPAVFLCREDCKGLCPRCGADRNAGPCSCAPEAEEAGPGGDGSSAPNPAWQELLRKLRLPDGE